MGLIVQKFGGSSVANKERLFNVADIVTKTYAKGNSVIVVVSAQGDTTDDLIAKAHEINEDASKREMDMLLTAGEQMSASLLAMAIEKLGYPVVSLLGWQAGFVTSSAYGSARIKRVEPDRIQKELDKKNIVVVTGFQGINRYDDMTTLGTRRLRHKRGCHCGGDARRPLPDLHRCGRRFHRRPAQGKRCEKA